MFGDSFSNPAKAIDFKKLISEAESILDEITAYTINEKDASTYAILRELRGDLSTLYSYLSKTEFFYRQYKKGLFKRVPEAAIEKLYDAKFELFGSTELLKDAITALSKYPGEVRWQGTIKIREAKNLLNKIDKFSTKVGKVIDALERS